MSNINEQSLRNLLRMLILESESEKNDEEEDNILGEPDLSSEKDRDNPDHDVDEAMTLGAASITGHQGPGNPAIEYDPENPKNKKKKKKKKRNL